MLFGLIIHTYRVAVVEMCGGGQKKRVVVELRIKQVVVGWQWWKWVHRWSGLGEMGQVQSQLHAQTMQENAQENDELVSTSMVYLGKVMCMIT